MASGDASRTWFPEMVDALRREWSQDLTWDQLVTLRDALDQTLQQIRKERRIRPPMMPCSACGKRHRAAPPAVSVRAMILAVGRFQIAPKDEVADLERRWRKYQQAGGLDRHGKRDSSPVHP